MQRIKDGFLDKIEKVIPLDNLSVLEIGCGDGSRSILIASHCKSLVGIEPDQQKLKQAAAHRIPNAKFKVGNAEKLDFNDQTFGVTMFTLSLHHVPIAKMDKAIDEAVRVTRKNGHIIFLEPTETGTFFESELKFDACDGDERKEKIAAYQAIKNHHNLSLLKELGDETIFQFESVDDFIETMEPKKNRDGIKEFLEKNNYQLQASRRISVARPK